MFKQNILNAEHKVFGDLKGYLVVSNLLIEVIYSTLYVFLS